MQPGSVPRGLLLPRELGVSAEALFLSGFPRPGQEVWVTSRQVVYEAERVILA
jgi:hypothetical protein